MSEKFRKIVYVVLTTISVIVVITSLLSILTNTESRFLKMLDFQRIQIFIFSLVSAVMIKIQIFL